MKKILTFILLLGLIGCSDSAYYKVQFDDVDRLTAGNKVFIKGLEVGEVKDLIIDDEKKVLATIWIGRNIKLTKGSTFTIHSTGFGERHIEIGLSDNNELINEDEIQKGHIQTPPDFRHLTKEQKDSLIMNDPAYSLAETFIQMLRKPNAKDSTQTR